jgi:hypothetical protein
MSKVKGSSSCTDSDEILFDKICRARQSKHPSKKEFPRYGNSGAELHIAHFTNTPGTQSGLPFVIKFAGKDKIRKEVRAIKILWNCIDDCAAFQKAFYEGDRGAILLSHQGTIFASKATESITLASEIWPDKVIPGYADAKNITTYLEGAYKKLRPAHEQKRKSKINPLLHYDWYLRKPDAYQRIADILDVNVDNDNITFESAEIYNPIKLLQMIRKPLTTYVSRVHGDMHLDNIVIHEDNLPRLIDFEWAHSRTDLLVDFVLMENSIRFKTFPKTVDHKQQLKVDQLLLEVDGCEKILDDTSLPIIYHRLANILLCVRGIAKEVIGAEFDFTRYLVSQFFVMFGLMKFYDNVIAMRALGLISKRIFEDGKYIKL